MLAAAEAHLGADGTLTLDSAARAAGVSKPGLMYHFPTKELLLTAVLERMTARCEEGMAQSLAATVDGAGTSSEASRGVGSEAGTGTSTAPDAAAGMVFADAPAPQRFLAYLNWACHAQLSPADLVIFADPHLRVTLTERWQEQLERWLHVPAGTLPGSRHRLLAVRLMADGIWFDRASGLIETTAAETEALRALALDLLQRDA